MTSTRTPTVAPKAMAGNRAIGEADLENRYVADADHLLGSKAARQAQILKFKKEQGQHGLVSLDAAIDWLEECNRELLTERIGKIWKALSGDVSIFKIGGDLLPSATMVHEDSSLPVSEFNALDLAVARKTKMYDDPRALRTLIERLWVPRNVLLRLFEEAPWPIPPWLKPVTGNQTDSAAAAVPDRRPIAEIIPSSCAAVSLENSEEEPVKNRLPGRPSSKSIYQATPKFSLPEAARAYSYRRAQLGENMPTIDGDKEWAKAEGYPQKPILKLRQNYKNRTAGQKKTAVK
jgi:hypothetical protein